MNRDERSSGSGSGAAAVVDPMIGQILDGRYRLTEKLGEGGMGEVYAAEHVHIEKRVALKLLRSEILANQEAVTRFHQEARSASSIGHKNIIRIEDFGQLPDGRIYLAMELLQGAPLSELIKAGLPAERLVGVLIQTGHGLSAAHKKGIVHRDMKPENVFVTLTAEGEDVPKLLDFGIAKMSAGEGNNHLTKTGTIFGTPFYMAPEQALGQNVDHRADVYAMGVIMYEAFGGAVPFQGDSFMAILTQHITTEPKPLAHIAAQHGKSLPPGIEEVIARCMRKEAEQRFQTMDELVAALVNVYRGLAGPGMSSYMQAHASSGTLLATPVPAHGGYQPQGPGRSGAFSAPPPHHSSTPMPYVTPPGPSGPVGREGGSGVRYPVPLPDPQFTSGMRSAGDSGLMARPKSKAGLIAVLFIVMAAIGGGVALLVLSQQDGDDAVAGDGTTTGDGTETPDPPSGKDPTSGKTGDPSSGKTGDPSSGKSGGKTSGGGTTDPTGTDDGGDPTGTDPPATADAGTEVVAAAADAGAGGEPAVAKVVVLVNSRPQGAEIIAADGSSLGRTPTNVWVEPGKPLEVTLKARGRKDLRASIDEKKKKVTLKLEKLPRPGPGPGPTDPVGDGGDTPPDVGEPDAPRDPCDEDPGSIECRCKKNPDLPECGLE